MMCASFSGQSYIILMIGENNRGTFPIVDRLPKRDQDVLFRTIDDFL